MTDYLNRMSMPSVYLPPGPAETMYEKIARSIAEFEEKLDDTQEVGARLVNFGAETIHIESVGFWGQHLVKFYGRTADGRPVELLQHFTQICVLLVAVPIEPNKKPRRIGFELTKNLQKP